MPTAHQPTRTSDAAQLPPFITDPPKRTRRGYKRVPCEGEPTVLPTAPGVVSVSLFGGRAAGRLMLVDCDVWETLADIAPRFVVNVVNQGPGRVYEYVRTGASALASRADQPGDKPTLSLARLVSGARRGQAVSHVNGDRFDLRRVNLLVDGQPVVGNAAHG